MLCEINFFLYLLFFSICFFIIRKNKFFIYLKGGYNVFSLAPLLSASENDLFKN